MTDMKHLDYINLVTDNDTQHLRMKEETYQGSWKKGGGRSAWFMLRRKIDRLLVMMARPPAPDCCNFDMEDLKDTVAQADGDTTTVDSSVLRYLRDCYLAEDVFAKIREQPGGEDGTVLAEIRDLRRYLLLVEAEMISRDVVAGKPIRPGTPEDGGHHEREETPDERYIKEPWIIPVEFFVRVNRSIYGGGGVFDTVYDTRGIYKILPPYLTKKEHNSLVFVSYKPFPIGDLARSISDLYANLTSDDIYILDISRVPADERDRWPAFPREQNNREYLSREEWQQALYKWHETETKWIISNEWKMWEKQT